MELTSWSFKETFPTTGNVSKYGILSGNRSNPGNNAGAVQISPHLDTLTLLLGGGVSLPGLASPCRAPACPRNPLRLCSQGGQVATSVHPRGSPGQVRSSTFLGKNVYFWALFQGGKGVWNTAHIYLSILHQFIIDNIFIICVSQVTSAPCRTTPRYGRLWPWPTTSRRSRSCPIPSLGFPTSEGSLDTRSPSSKSFASYFEHWLRCTAVVNPLLQPLRPPLTRWPPATITSSSPLSSTASSAAPFCFLCSNFTTRCVARSIPRTRRSSGSTWGGAKICLDDSHKFLFQIF